ncbi:aromatic ring-hydroxylating oxygenase subunit alpha [Larsenimonas suaedae]|uniref:Aromatic ring-hydroxylating dioxygenase subunit alpha n=1 Tax=Larsenimonas suaedae TaxID=1851019 RepID=A0ABU1GW39_9GAMM|nr:aromatic ring-hydroxylating dioxygenase subunit alpha [Larsenimonas suaedae]MCM2973376.1 aromatic ring-hydroxylating dioxygenase subunit alpha [Larsenimonas suaedae]MDR5896269.1 aromatic ring-hydroxylating dioxygenase subunit alpha [Larsenimonas suaedae]
MFPKNTWYVACTPDEIDGKPLGRTVCNEKIVFFRAEEGKVAAVEDFCPHRGAPLSLGFVRDGQLVCGYHGLEMSCSGKCSSMPGQRVRGFPSIRAYPVEERHGFIWVWTGDAEQADPALIPELHWANDPAWAYGGGLYHVGCDYRLMVDNLMDLTHETYVHASSIGQPEIEESAPETKVDGDEVITSRYMENISAPPFWQAALRGNNLPDDQPVDRWQVCRFTPPSHVLIDVGVALAGKGGIDAPAEFKASSTVVDFITPETDTSIWYFWGMARNFNPEDQELTDRIREGQGTIFAEDLEILEAQQQNLLKYPDRKLLMLNIDGGGVQARRVIDRILKEEQSASPSTSAKAG